MWAACGLGGELRVLRRVNHLLTQRTAFFGQNKSLGIELPRHEWFRVKRSLSGSHPQGLMVKPKSRAYWNSRLQPCMRHGETHCWVQENGQHASRYSCKCAEAGQVSCPIDAHRIPWCLDNPEFGELSSVQEEGTYVDRAAPTHSEQLSIWV